MRGKILTGLWICPGNLFSDNACGNCIRGLAKMNYLGMNISEEYGGMNADAVTTGIVAEEIARVLTACISRMRTILNSFLKRALRLTKN